MPCGTYIIKNKQNGKVYVGSSVDITDRWGTHRRSLRKGTHHSIKLQRAWDKYGEDNFTFKVLRVCLRDYLITNEQALLDSTNAYTHGYNCSKDAGRVTISRRKRKMAARKARPKLIADAKAQWADPEIRNKMVEAIGKASRTPEHRANVSKALTGRKMSPKWRKNMSESKKKFLKKNPGHNKNHGDLMRNKFATDPEFREKHRKGIAKRWADPEQRRLASEKTKKQMLKNGTARTITFNGITDTITGWSEKLGIPRGNIRHRLEKGHPPEIILSKELLKSGRKKRG